MSRQDTGTGRVVAPGLGRSWADGLTVRAAADPEALAFRYLPGGREADERITYGELLARTAAVAVALRAAGLEGRRVLVLHPPGPGFIAAFLGCLAARAVAVPVYPPNPARPDASLDRLLGIVTDCQPAAALTAAGQGPKIAALADRHPALGRIAWIDTDAIPGDPRAPWSPPDDESLDVAFLQYTSGSTSAPKGVMVTHRNITRNTQRIGAALSMSPASRGLSWLPPYHDMGLIGHILQPLAYGIDSVLMPPLAFLQRPMRWLEAIAESRATISFAPNFAYDLVLRKVRPDHLETLDLSCWASAGNGAEPVRAETMRRFIETFAPCGFRPEAFCPSYGLAECTLMVSSRHGLVSRTVDAAALARDEMIAVPDGAPGSRTLVSVGPAAAGLRIAIVSPDTGQRVPDGTVGEIWVAGDSVAAGYWNRPDDTRETFGALLPEPDGGPFLRTGDLGVLADGELHVTGRLKDLVVIDGRNHYPQDIEHTVEAHPAVRSGGVIAFSVDDGGGERLVVVAETVRRAGPDTDAGALAGAAREIRAAVAERHGLALKDLVWVPPGGLPRTGSGKPQRRACRQRFLDDALGDVVART